MRVPSAFGAGRYGVRWRVTMRGRGGSDRHLGAAAVAELLRRPAANVGELAARLQEPPRAVAAALRGPSIAPLVERRRGELRPKAGGDVGHPARPPARRAGGGAVELNRRAAGGRGCCEKGGAETGGGRPSRTRPARGPVRTEGELSRAAARQSVDTLVFDASQAVATIKEVIIAGSACCASNGAKAPDARVQAIDVGCATHA